MKFEFDTNLDGPKDAAALVALLAIMYPDEIARVLDGAADELEITTTNNTVHGDKAADGYADTSAADAFANPTSSVAPAAPGTDGSSTGGATAGQTATAIASPSSALDSAGTPWDARIHSGTKGTNKDGTWSRRRNTPDELFDKVMAELKGARIPPPPPATNDHVEEGAEQFPNAPAAPPPPPPTTAVVPPPPPTSTPAASTTPANVTFPQLVVKVTKAQANGQITKEIFDGFLASFGLSKTNELASATADTLQAVNALVDDHING